MNRANSQVIWLLTVVLLFNIFSSSNAWAEGINFRGEFNYLNSDSETTNKTTGQVNASVFSRFNQRYNLDFSKTLYPYLILKGGTFYELNNSTSTSQGTETEAEEKILRPFAELNLNNPLYKAGMGYRHTQIENKTTGTPATQDFKDEFNTILGWRPVGLPESNLRYSYTHTYDDPETLDLINQQLSFDTKYVLWRNLGIDYSYSRNAREDTLKSSETLAQNHNGKINYSHNFFNRRLSMSTSYRIRYNTFEFPATESVESPLLRNAGFSYPDDTPSDGHGFDKVSNPALIDGNVTASAVINIGSGVNTEPLRNIGLQLTFAANVSKIHLWVDRPLSSSIADSFSWSIYTSPDNTDTSTWTLHATVSPGSFGTFENRFEITFAEVNTQYIKVVTTPLSTGEPKNIYVTEMQAFTTVSGVLVEKKTTAIDHNYNLNITGKLSDKINIGYNMYYRLQEQDPSSTERTELSNGINLSYIFNRVFTASTSFSQTDRTSPGKNKVSNNYAASLRAAYWEALKQILTYRGTKTTEEDGASSTNSLFLRTNAELYRGWSAFFDAGYSWNEPLDGAETTSTTVRTGTNIVPNNKVTININYSVTQTQQSAGDTSRSELDFQAFVIPFRALSFNARVSMMDRGDSTATLYNYSANWSPFPDGTLQFFLGYTETLRPEDEQKSRTIRPSLKWTLSRHFFLDMGYSISESETRLEATESNSFSANLRVIF